MSDCCDQSGGEGLEVLLRPTGPSQHPYVCKAVDGEISGASATGGGSNQREGKNAWSTDVSDGGAAVWLFEALNVKVKHREICRFLTQVCCLKSPFAFGARLHS